jgi:hypothetical protein
MHLLPTPPSPRAHAFDEEDLCPHCGAHLDDAVLARIGCEASNWTNPGSYRGLAVTPGERMLGKTPYSKGIWIGHVAASAGDVLTEEQVLSLWEIEVYYEVSARFGDPARLS